MHSDQSIAFVEVRYLVLRILVTSWLIALPPSTGNGGLVECYRFCRNHDRKVDRTSAFDRGVRFDVSGGFAGFKELV
ncbi:hypothetical protein CEXT_774701 [Caerostris extrusa]|uniref:Secreted protein n=1 Tax=Caerostris extrusa TaxID=172846 RepID=A0AAV4VKZ4_CAEEX|nr:hypothetical protein CEXT_774701 [Caerostris extrusa]